MDLDLDQLEAVARAATEGPWTFCGTDNNDECRMEHGPFPDCGYSHWTMMRPEDAAFIAAADPPTVLRLIAMAREGERMRETLRLSEGLHARLSEPASCRQLWRDRHPELFDEGDDEG